MHVHTFIENFLNKKLVMMIDSRKGSRIASGHGREAYFILHIII